MWQISIRANSNAIDYTSVEFNLSEDIKSYFTLSVPRSVPREDLMEGLLNVTN